jgi:hypothetical protein
MRHPLFTAASLVLLAAVFCRASNAPIQPFDTVNHWKYGEWIWQHKQLPAREPFAPAFSDQERPLVDTAWLGQVVCYLAYSCAGMGGISLLYGLVEVLKTALYLAAFRRVSGSPWLALLGVVLVQAGLWSTVGVFRPQTLGEVCWAAVLVVAGSRQQAAGAAGSRQRAADSTDERRLSLPAVCCLLPAIFALWANLDASFVVGLIFLAVLLVGRVLDGERDPRLALATVLSAAAACINPYGPRLLATVFVNSRQFILEGMPAWQPLLPLASYGAQAFAASVLIVLVTLRYSPRRFSAGAVLLLLVFGLGAWFVERLLPWWLTLWPLVLLPHWRQEQQAAGTAGSRQQTAGSEMQAWKKGIAFCCLLPAACCLLFLLFRGPPQFAAGTPVEVADQLKSLLAQRPARIFAPLAWGDYLLWELPPSGQVVLYSQYEAFPWTHWEWYARVFRMRPEPDDLRTLLDRAGVSVMALSADPPGNDLFTHFLHGKEPGWQVVYVNEDVTALIAERVR